MCDQVTNAFKSTPLRWQVADASRMFQDEYLEWSVARDSKTKDILSVTFTCEGPEVCILAKLLKAEYLTLVTVLASILQLPA